MELQKRRKNYFSSNGTNQKKRKQYSLEPGMTGFLCTCNFREKDCVRDAYKILNEFADDLYGTNKTKESDNPIDKGSAESKDESADEAEQNDDDEDISTALNKEISDLKAESSKPISARRFQVVDTGVKNVVFIKSTLPNPLELVTKIVEELDKTKKQRTRFLLRLLPIEVVCKAYMNDIKLKAEILFERYFAQEPKTFSIVFSRHSNNSIQREVIIEDLAEIINKKNPGNKADLKNPELAVVVEVIRGICLLSIAPNYYKFRKYNLLELCNTKPPKEEIKKTESEHNKATKVETETEEETKEDENQPKSPEKEEAKDEK